MTESKFICTEQQVNSTAPDIYDKNDTSTITPVPVHLKVTLTIREAAEYSNIGINKIEYLLRQPHCPFVLYVGKRKLVKRKEFEIFISNKVTI